jgi:hypothetical protein
VRPNFLDFFFATFFCIKAKESRSLGALSAAQQSAGTAEIQKAGLSG